MSWRERAACRGVETERFFPLKPGDIPDDIAELCGSCPVAQPCDDDAEAQRDQYGIRAGKCRETLRIQRGHRARREDEGEAA